jgi:hypothetical protein
MQLRSLSTSHLTKFSRLYFHNIFRTNNIYSPPGSINSPGVSGRAHFWCSTKVFLNKEVKIYGLIIFYPSSNGPVQWIPPSFLIRSLLHSVLANMKNVFETRCHSLRIDIYYYYYSLKIVVIPFPFQNTIYQDVYIYIQVSHVFMTEPKFNVPQVVGHALNRWR